jgi:nucleotidyltransferase/DNA polymerase involved in DNA repair
VIELSLIPAQDNPFPVTIEIMARTILHVDMDAFYAAVEQREHPELLGKPVIVGADPKQGRGRGIVATCSYEARQYGVRSAQPISKAWQLCPQGIYLRPDIAKYSRVSDRIMDILMGYTSLVEQVSIDEAFLDVTGSLRLFGSGPDIARGIRASIQGKFGLTASVGVAANKYVAKVASDLEKPDGLVIVDAGREKEFLAPLEVSRLWGVGEKTEAALRKVGLIRIGQLVEYGRPGLVRRFGKMGDHLWHLAQGKDKRRVTPEEGFKSIGHENTFAQDSSDRALVFGTLLGLTENVARRLRAKGARSRTITVKLREADFTTRTKRKTLKEPADTAEQLYPVAESLLATLLREGEPVRLIGVYASNLVKGTPPGQLGLFSTPPGRDRELARALDNITERYGKRAITRATLISRKGEREII